MYELKNNDLTMGFVKVVDRCDMNKMTAANLAVVFGPNLCWSNDKSMSLSHIGKVKNFPWFKIVKICHDFRDDQ